MSESDDQFLVLSLRECRHLPAPSGYTITAEACFGGQVLQTEPLRLADDVNFNTELMWETDRRCLQWHRQSRSSIKLRLFATRSYVSDLRQMMGYIVVSVRDAREQAPLQWCKLLGCRMRSPLEPPSVRLSLGVVGRPGRVTSSLQLSQSTSVQETSSCSKDSDSSTHSPPTRGPSETASSQLVPVLDKRRKLFQIGPADVPQELFSLTVIVVCAQHLTSLIPVDASVLWRSESEFSFFFSLMGSDVFTDKFSDAVRPSFPAQKSMVRISCNRNYLQQYLQQLNTLDIYLCCGDLSLGVASVPVYDLGCRLEQLSTRPLLLDTYCPISTSLNGPVSCDADGNAPSVGISLEIQRIGDELGRRDLSVKTAVASKPVHLADPIPEETCIDALKRSAETDRPSPARCEASSSSCCRHYRFVLDLRALLIDATISVRKVMLRFSYPYFGSASERSVGPLSVEPDCTSFLPDVTYEYNFAAPMDWLNGTLERFPLAVEVRGVESNSLLGTAWLDLHRVLEPSSVQTPSSGSGGLHRTCSVSADVCCEAGRTQGHLNAFLSIEDMGESDVSWITTDLHVSLPSPNPECAEIPEAVEVPCGAPQPPSDVQQCVEARGGDNVFMSARNLEQWMQQQQQLFADKLSQKESAHIAALNEEWKRCDASREVQFQQRLRSVGLLEQKLMAGLQSLEDRRRQLDEESRQLETVRGQMRRGCDQVVSQAHQLAADVQKLTERRVQQAEVLLNRLQEQMSSIQQRLGRLKVGHSSRNSELQRQLDTAVKSKVYYKYRWAESASQMEELKGSQAQALMDKHEEDMVEIARLKARLAERGASIVSEYPERRILGEIQDTDEPHVPAKVTRQASKQSIVSDFDAGSRISVQSDAARDRIVLPRQVKFADNVLLVTSGKRPTHGASSPISAKPTSAISSSESLAKLPETSSPPASCPSSASSSPEYDLRSRSWFKDYKVGSSALVSSSNAGQEVPDEELASGSDQCPRSQRLRQLQEERRSLLDSGLYTDQDHVIQLLGDIISKLESQE